MVLYKLKKDTKVDKISRKISVLLSEREAKWNEKQQLKLKERLEVKLKKATKSKDYTKKLLQNCKSWGGPCTSIDELRLILNNKGDQEIFIVKTELAYYVHTHKAHRIARPDLFKQNGIAHDEKLINLALLLEENDHNVTCTIADLPTNKEVITALEDGHVEQSHQSRIPTLKLNELCVVVWQNCDSKYEWYIAYVKQITDDGYVVDHLHRVEKNCHNKWKYPSVEDVQTAEKEQIVNCIVVEGNWDITPDTRKRVFTLENRKAIEKAFYNHVK